MPKFLAILAVNLTMETRLRRDIVLDVVDELAAEAKLKGMIANREIPLPDESPEEWRITNQSISARFGIEIRRITQIP